MAEKPYNVYNLCAVPETSPAVITVCTVVGIGLITSAGFTGFFGSFSSLSVV